MCVPRVLNPAPVGGYTKVHKENVMQGARYSDRSWLVANLLCVSSTNGIDALFVIWLIHSRHIETDLSRQPSCKRVLPLYLILRRRAGLSWLRPRFFEAPCLTQQRPGVWHLHCLLIGSWPLPLCLFGLYPGKPLHGNGLCRLTKTGRAGLSSTQTAWQGANTDWWEGLRGSLWATRPCSGESVMAAVSTSSSLWSHKKANSLVKNGSNDLKLGRQVVKPCQNRNIHLVIGLGHQTLVSGLHKDLGQALGLCGTPWPWSDGPALQLGEGSLNKVTYPLPNKRKRIIRHIVAT